MTITTPVHRKSVRRCGGDEGAVAVEAAITFSALLLFILGIIEFGTALWQWNTMELAVEQAGRYVMIHSNDATPCGTACAKTQMQAILTSAAACATPSAGQICVDASINAGSPQTMTLTARYNFNFLALAGSFTMASQANFPLD